MSETFLICSLNWLGDCIMSMPAIQVLRKQKPDARIVLLVKPKLAALWEMHDAVDRIVMLESGMAGVLKAVDELKRETVDKAYVFPQSFRSALVPALAKVSQRRGQAGHHRAWMLTSIVKDKDCESSRHQAWEYVDILDLDVGIEGLPLPLLNVPVISNPELERLLRDEKGRKMVGMFPGTARGSAKCWPVEHFIEVGRMLAGQDGCRVVVFGSSSEVDICSAISEGVGGDVVDLSGKTNLKELAGVLRNCDVVICNDSGGMHLAAAVGAGVVAVYGMTDPLKTGPWGNRHKIVQRNDICRSRDIARNDPEAVECLRSIKPGLVYDSVKEFLG